jgi:hypothetical protein
VVRVAAGDFPAQPQKARQTWAPRLFLPKFWIQIGGWISLSFDPGISFHHAGEAVQQKVSFLVAFSSQLPARWLRHFYRS